ncbi:hypothetical protein Chor_016802 [Crotalus horridus]
MAVSAEGSDLEASLLSFEKLDRASPDLWPEQCRDLKEFKKPITSSPPKWMAELENDDIDMLRAKAKLLFAGFGLLNSRKEASVLLDKLMSFCRALVIHEIWTS